MNPPAYRNHFLHSFCLSATVVFSWLWTHQQTLRQYNFQLIAFLIIGYFIVRLIIPQKTDRSLIVEGCFLTTLLLVLLSSSGGLNSPLFFLSYFLLFASALLFETATTLTLLIALVLYFTDGLNSLQTGLQIISLFLITPLSIAFGKQYLKLLASQKKIRILAKESSLLQKDVASQETNALLWLSLNFKNTLLKIVHINSELLSDIGHLTYTQKEKLQTIYEAAKELLKSGEKLQETMDKETD